MLANRGAKPEKAKRFIGPLAGKRPIDPKMRKWAEEMLVGMTYNDVQHRLDLRQRPSFKERDFEDQIERLNRKESRIHKGLKGITKEEEKRMVLEKLRRQLEGTRRMKARVIQKRMALDTDLVSTIRLLKDKRMRLVDMKGKSGNLREFAEDALVTLPKYKRKGYQVDVWTIKFLKNVVSSGGNFVSAIVMTLLEIGQAEFEKKYVEKAVARPGTADGVMVLSIDRSTRMAVDVKRAEVKKLCLVSPDKTVVVNVDKVIPPGKTEVRLFIDGDSGVPVIVEGKTRAILQTAGFTQEEVEEAIAKLRKLHTLQKRVGRPLKQEEMLECLPNTTDQSASLKEWFTRNHEGSGAQ